MDTIKIKGRTMKVRFEDHARYEPSHVLSLTSRWSFDEFVEIEAKRHLGVIFTDRDDERYSISVRPEHMSYSGFTGRWVVRLTRHAARSDVWELADAGNNILSHHDTVMDALNSVRDLSDQ